MTEEGDAFDRLFIYLDGFEAYDTGLCEGDCPYLQGTWQARCWLDGFRGDDEGDEEGMER
jgi:hypothetical protein